MRTSEHLDKLFFALNKVQGVLTGAKKDSVNPYFKNGYADLESCWEACRKLLLENGLSIYQGGGIESGQPVAYTRIGHVSGQWIESFLPLLIPEQKRDMQALGSAFSYARRYGLSGATGLVQTDDDGHAARQEPPRPPNYTAPAGHSRVTPTTAPTRRIATEPPPVLGAPKGFGQMLSSKIVKQDVGQRPVEQPGPGFDEFQG